MGSTRRQVPMRTVIRILTTSEPGRHLLLRGRLGRTKLVQDLACVSLREVLEEERVADLAYVRALLNQVEERAINNRTLH